MKRIFIGSSSEALSYAQQIHDILKVRRGIEPLLWTEVFDPGSLTFEVIEHIARRIAGAVFLATPDDESIIRGMPARVPRTNVMIEFGYLAACLGRRNIALCRYDGVELASDLKGFTYVGMGVYAGLIGTQVIETIAAQQILTWAEGLPDLIDTVPLRNISHGYTGRWKVKNRFRQWRSRSVTPPDYVDFEGVLDLHLPPEPKNGDGVLHGTLHVNLSGCYAQIAFSAVVANAYEDNDGSLHFTSGMHSRQVLAISGDPPQLDGFQHAFRGPHQGVWVLRPSRNQASLTGTFRLRAGASYTDIARCKLTKLR